MAPLNEIPPGGVSDAAISRSTAVTASQTCRTSISAQPGWGTCRL